MSNLAPVNVKEVDAALSVYNDEITKALAGKIDMIVRLPDGRVAGIAHRKYDADDLLDVLVLAFADGPASGCLCPTLCHISPHCVLILIQTVLSSAVTLFLG